MATFNAILSGEPNEMPSYNVGMAETFSWVPIENDVNRPLFARATYITNAGDLKVRLSALTLNTDGLKDKIAETNTLLNSLTSVNQKGFVITANTTEVYGVFSSIKTIEATTFAAITAENSSIPTLSMSFPSNFVIEGPLRGYKLSTGSVIAYKA
jgi:hypothetical protein